MSQDHKNGQTTQTSNVKMARLLWVEARQSRKFQEACIQGYSYPKQTNEPILTAENGRFRSTSAPFKDTYIIVHVNDT